MIPFMSTAVMSDETRRKIADTFAAIFRIRRRASRARECDQALLDEFDATLMEVNADLSAAAATRRKRVRAS